MQQCPIIDSSLCWCLRHGISWANHERVPESDREQRYRTYVFLDRHIVTHSLMEMFQVYVLSLSYSIILVILRRWPNRLNPSSSSKVSTICWRIETQSNKSVICDRTDCSLSACLGLWKLRSATTRSLSTVFQSRSWCFSQRSQISYLSW